MLKLELLEPIEKFTDWERFQSFTSELISPKIEIKSGIEADKAARDFTASVASACSLSTNKITLSDINNDIPGLDRLLKYKQRLRKLSQETWDPACKTVVNYLSLLCNKVEKITQKKETTKINYTFKHHTNSVSTIPCLVTPL
jgi:hypothetical protein